jgi:hypothetical protein
MLALVAPSNTVEAGYTRASNRDWAEQFGQDAKRLMAVRR